MNSALLPASSRGFNRQSVQEAIKKIQGKLNQYKTLPPNGLVIFSGHPEDESKRILFAIEPLKPVATTLYLCDNRFHTDILRDQISCGDEKIGFVVIDGHSTSFFLMTGNVKETLFHLEVNLPKKHGRGGQSQNRFARIREEKRGWYISKVTELFTQYFMENGQLKVNSLVFAGCANFKHELAKKLDPRVNDKILAFVDVQYGGENGFHQAIELSLNILKESKFVLEQKTVQKFFDLIVLDGPYCFQTTSTLPLLEQGLVETLIVWDELPDYRFELVSQSDPNEKKIVYRPDQSSNFPGYEILSSISVLDWILEHHKDFGAKVELISSVSSPANQFILGFGGIGGILRFKINEEHLNQENKEEEEDEVEDDGSEYDYVY